MLISIWVLSGLFTVVTADSIRDIYEANAIANHGALTLVGPQLAVSIHQGPLWFYLLAIPAALFDNWGSIALFVFFLSAMKYWLAYVLGRNIYSPQLGLLFALFLALPSWTNMQLILWTATSVLETALLLFLISLWGVYGKPNAFRWLVSGFCFALALHAHPTALPFGFFVLLACRKAGYCKLWLVWFLLGGAILYIPYGIDQLINGFSDFTAAKRYQQNEFSPGGPFSMLRLLYSIVVIGPNLYYQTALPKPLSMAAIVLHWSMITSCVYFAVRRYRLADENLKSFLKLAIISFLLAIVFVVFIRERTPNHFSYAPNFALALVYGIVAAIALQGHTWPKAIPLLTGYVLLLVLASSIGISQKRYSNSIAFQESVLFDIKNIEGPWALSGLEIPAIHSRLHGRFLCEQQPVVFHGPYAALVDAHVGIEAELYCGARDQILIGGITDNFDYAHLAGISHSMSQIIGSLEQYKVGNVYFYTPLAISAAGQALALVEGDLNPPRNVFTGGSGETQHLALHSSVQSALLISKPVGFLLSLEVKDVECNGKPAHLAHRYNYSWLYTCSNDEETNSMDWQVNYVASDDRLIDAILLPFAAR